MKAGQFNLLVGGTDRLGGGILPVWDRIAFPLKEQSYSLRVILNWTQIFCAGGGGHGQESLLPNPFWYASCFLSWNNLTWPLVAREFYSAIIDSDPNQTGDGIVFTNAQNMGGDEEFQHISCFLFANINLIILANIQRNLLLSSDI